jgi:protein-tyrosine-phosphatase
MAKPCAPTEGTLHVLLLLTGNRCAFMDLDSRKGCEEVLAKRTWPRMKAKACHIRGARPGSPRYDDAMTDDDRRHFDNIIMLCPTHHEVIDYLEPDRYTVEVLQDIKERHERAHEDSQPWATDGELARYSRLIREVQFDAPRTVTGEGKVTAEGTLSGTGTVQPPTVKVQAGEVMVGPGNEPEEPSAILMEDGDSLSTEDGGRLRQE